MTVATWLGGFGVNVGLVEPTSSYTAPVRQLDEPTVKPAEVRHELPGESELPWPSWFTQCESVKKPTAIFQP